MILRFFLALMLAAPGTAGILYVDATSDGANNGTSWTDAFNHLQDALTLANNSHESGLMEIRIAGGHYTPDQGGGVVSGDREASFHVKRRIMIAGGYAGWSAPDPNERDMTRYQTILSGDLNSNDQPDFMGIEENSLHVVTLSGHALVDGVTITGGNANKDLSTPTSGRGGGVYIEHYGATLSDCRIEGNHGALGGGIFSKGHTTLHNCTFENNAAVQGHGISLQSCGGGFYNDMDGNVTLVDCAFFDNLAAFAGGGIYNHHNTQASLTRCVFVGNKAAFYGGGIMNMDNNRTMTVQVEGCTFRSNTSKWSGAAIHSTRCSFTLFNSLFTNNVSDRGAGLFVHHGSSFVCNCVFFANRASTYGGAIYFEDMDEDPLLVNCILWGNTAGRQGPQIGQGLHAMKRMYKTRVQYCNVQGGPLDFHASKARIDMTHSIDVDPAFVQPGYWDRGVWIKGDYHLQSEIGHWDPNGMRWVQDPVTSPCIDAGDPKDEWQAELWPHGKRINMGVYGGTSQASLSLSVIGEPGGLNFGE